MNAKVKKVNELLKEELELHGIDYIKHDNILFSNMGNDGLHVNPGCVRKLAVNFKMTARVNGIAGTRSR